MNTNDKQMLEQCNALLNDILEGRQSRLMPDSIEATGDDVAALLLQKCIQIEKSAAELRLALANICDGEYVNLRSDHPFYPIVQELNEQLAGLAWRLQQLALGNMVSKLDGVGPLCDSFNLLVDRLAQSVQEQHTGLMDDTITVNRHRYRQILSALNNLRIMVIEANPAGEIRFANHAAREYLGEIQNIRDIAENQGDLLRHLARANHKDRTFPILGEVYEEQTNHWYKATSDKLVGEDGQISFVHMIDNISEWKRHEFHLKRTASTDNLTGTFHRQIGLETLEKALGDPGTHGCAAFIDVDNLKIINDTYGHTTGDEAIQAIAAILLASVREQDVVCRYGGDEFMIVFSNCTRERVDTIFQRIQNRLGDYEKRHDAPFALSISYGVVDLAQVKQRTVQHVIEQMDQIMYSYKKKKK